MKEKIGLYLLGVSSIVIVGMNLWGMVGAMFAWREIGLLGLAPVVVSCFVFNVLLGGFAGDCFDRARDKGKATECPPRT